MRKIHRWGWAGLLAIFLCQPFGFEARGQNSKNAEVPWKVEYHDGSGNGYRFWRDSSEANAHFQYEPVQPKESSSGSYSGGEARFGSLDTKQAEELWQRIRNLHANASLQAKTRELGTGAFKIDDRGKKEEFLIKDGEELQGFNRFLAKLKADKK